MKRPTTNTSPEENKMSGAKRIKLDFSETVTILVGKKEKKYVLHTCYITKTSEFFATALSGNWKEAKNGETRIPDLESVQMDCYIQWLYTSEIIIDIDNEILDSGDKTKIATAKYDHLMKLYTMGYFLLDTTFRNAIIDATIETKEQNVKFPSVTRVADIWARTPPNCPMKRLIFRYWVKGAQASELSKVFLRVPMEVNQCLLEEFVALRDANNNLSPPTVKNRCNCHEHDEKHPKCA